MQKLIVALCLSGAAAYVAPVAPSAGSKLAASKDEVVALAEANPDFLGKAIGFWDPLGALDTNFWGLGNEGTIGYLRHAEIKHGRIAMAGFLGFCAQSLPAVAGEHAVLPYRGFVPDVTPQEQWDNIPLYGKLQILVIVGMLESYGEILDPHYTKGGLPGYYPPIKGKRPELIFNLYDPFGFFEQDSAEKKARGRLAEVNNGRLAMIGLFSLLAESAVPGSVPFLDQFDFPQYAGNVMVPFEGQFTLL
mmetsp:Transcript_28453/g.85847  ORF Transcript_28453/g.85847 Transcript_28453/m.85847 type:complete len:248 (-) Transcript_28453:98-841(-)